MLKEHKREIGSERDGATERREVVRQVDQMADRAREIEREGERKTGHCDMKNSKKKRFFF